MNTIRIARIGITLIILLLSATPILAHVPSFPTETTSPDRAVDIPDATKSWVFYDTLSEGETKYYRLTIDAGDRLSVSTFTPVNSEFSPSIVIMSPSLDENNPTPAGVIVPEGFGTIVIDGTRPDAPTYEPFTPAANYHTANIEQPVESKTTYLVGIFEPTDTPGPVGISTGYKEEFSVIEYVTVPFDLIRVHRWEGQSYSTVFGPLILTIIVGISFVRNRWEGLEQHTYLRILVTSAGVLITATGVQTAIHMGIALTKTGLIPSALVTTVFVLVPIGSGTLVLIRSLRTEFVLDYRFRLGLVAAGVLSFLTWAGFVLGPVILIGVAAIPKFLKRIDARSPTD